MSPDGMHTIADFISHVIDMLGGKQNTIKVKECENSFSRFEEVWPSEEVHEEGQPDEHSVQPKKKKKETITRKCQNCPQVAPHGHFLKNNCPLQMKEHPV